MARNREPEGHCVALYRKATYSPLQHLANDAAIMDAVAYCLEQRGWRVTKSSETLVETDSIPAVDLYLNMCQGPRASARLRELEAEGALLVNRPSSVLACHRHEMVKAIAAAGVAFPRTIIVPTQLDSESAHGLQAFAAGRDALWVKRGDVHAERMEDVVRTAPGGLADTLEAFAARGIARVAVQEHVPGPVLKFYGLADRRYFRFYGADAGPDATAPAVDLNALRALAFRAAAALGLQVFGGDVALPAPNQPVLIDLNDWPSFAPFRAEAAQAIARFAHAAATQGVAA